MKFGFQNSKINFGMKTGPRVRMDGHRTHRRVCVMHANAWIKESPSDVHASATRMRGCSRALGTKLAQF